MSKFNVLGTVLGDNQVVDVGFDSSGLVVEANEALLVVRFGVNENGDSFGSIIKPTNYSLNGLTRDLKIEARIILEGMGVDAGEYDLMEGIKLIIEMLSVMEESIFGGVEYSLLFKDGRYVFIFSG
jgi:hypothetical protein